MKAKAIKTKTKNLNKLVEEVAELADKGMIVYDAWLFVIEKHKLTKIEADKLLSAYETIYFK